MAFRIKRKETVEEALKRVLREQIEKAEAELKDEKGRDLHESIHQARKRCKKIRGIYRLIRPEIPEVYRRENRRFRDAARELSAVRDADAMIETYDALMNRFGDELEDRRAFANIRRRLTLRRNRIADEEVDLDAKVERVQEALDAARKELDGGSLSAEGFASLEAGLAKTYKRGRKAMRRALAKPTNERFHEWRKRTKYYRFHARLLRGMWKDVLSPLEKEVDKLGELLGKDHDFAVLTELLHSEREQFGSKADLAAFLGYIDARQQELKNEARCLGERVFASKRKELVRLCGSYWETWHSEWRPMVV